MNDSLLSAIGDTPLVRLSRLFPDMAVHAKLELLNPGGSAKDRPAFTMLTEAMTAGRLQAGETVVESSSGNMAIGLAQACRILGLQFICVIDVKTTPTNRRLLEAYGVELEVVCEPHPVTGDWLDARICRVQDIVQRTPRAWWPNQYENVANVDAHRTGTAAEIHRALGRAPDVIVAAASTCGTLGGILAWADEAGAPVSVVGVDVEGSRAFGGSAGPRLIPGIGSSRPPLLVDPARIAKVVVSEGECVVGCRELVRTEAIFAGGSAGGVVAATRRILPSLPTDSVVVVVLMDRGERYLDTIYSDEWVAAHVASYAQARRSWDGGET
jgi:2,3-diaminopropionate biosynthesis protein SbnA